MFDLYRLEGIKNLETDSHHIYLALGRIVHLEYFASFCRN